MGTRTGLTFLSFSVIIIFGLASAGRPLIEANKESNNSDSPDALAINIGMDWGKGLLGGSMGLGIGVTPSGGLRLQIGTGDGIVGSSKQPGSGGEQSGGGSQQSGGSCSSPPSTGGMPNPPTCIGFNLPLNQPGCSPLRSSGAPGPGMGNSVNVKNDVDNRTNKSQSIEVHPGEKDDKKNNSENIADHPDVEGDMKAMSENHEQHPALDGDESKNNLEGTEYGSVRADEEKPSKDESGDHAGTP